MAQLLLNQAFFKEHLAEHPITVIDGGARGEIFRPFDEVDEEMLRVIRFEPDPDASVSKEGGQIVIPKALWCEEKEIPLHIAHSSAASSTLPFHTELQKYIDPYAEVRRTRETISVPATTIDLTVAEHALPSIDLIKLDIHGAEFEVLQGAEQTLDSTLALLIESWTIPIHKGQKTRASVELSALEKGFYVFEEFTRSAWGRKPGWFEKKQPVSQDTLYFKDPLIDHNIQDRTSALKLIGLADLFSHHGFAWQLTEYAFGEKWISRTLREKIIQLLKRKKRRLWDKQLSRFAQFLARKGSRYA